MTTPFVEVERDGDVCIVRLARDEKLNALSTAVERDLQRALESDDVRTARCIVLTGSGRAFSAGADVTEFAERTPESVAAYYRETGRVYEQVAALPQPTLAAVHGYCLGGGLELALATDVRIADETAVFGFPEVALGIIPSSGGVHRATRVLGPARAKLLILLGGRIGADEALAAGLVAEVVHAGEALERARTLARGLAALPPLAVAVAKQAIDAAAESPRGAALLVEQLAYGFLSQTDAARGAAEDFGR